MFINRHSTPLHLLELAKFLGGQTLGRLAPRTEPTDIMFLFCDHFEGKNLTLTSTEVERWVELYPKLAGNHRDSDGYPPRHSWFYLYADDTDNIALLRTLSTLSTLGYGEIEFHLHHGRGYLRGQPVRNVFPDVESGEQLRMLLQRALRDFNEAGALITAEPFPQVRFGVIHGAWALANSRRMSGDHGWCGVDNELEILAEMGCYADFTFPAWGTMQPAKLNSIYYAGGDPTRARAHYSGVDLRVNHRGRNGLVIFEGPAYGGSDISPTSRPSPQRTKAWIRSRVHVKGRPNWIFVKVHTHGCQNEQTLQFLLGEEMDRFFASLEEWCASEPGYRLHYVTAREAYNIAKAAEAGLDGNPHDYRDFVIPTYQNSKPRRLLRS